MPDALPDRGNALPRLRPQLADLWMWATPQARRYYRARLRTIKALRRIRAANRRIQKARDAA